MDEQSIMTSILHVIVVDFCCAGVTQVRCAGVSIRIASASARTSFNPQAAA